MAFATCFHWLRFLILLVLFDRRLLCNTVLYFYSKHCLQIDLMIGICHVDKLLKVWLNIICSSKPTVLQVSSFAFNPRMKPGVTILPSLWLFFNLNYYFWQKAYRSFFLTSHFSSWKHLALICLLSSLGPLPLGLNSCCNIQSPCRKYFVNGVPSHDPFLNVPKPTVSAQLISNLNPRTKVRCYKIPNRA